MAQQVEKPLSEEVAERRERAAQVEERERAQFASTFERAQQGQMMADSYMRDMDALESGQDREARVSVDNLSAYGPKRAPGAHGRDGDAGGRSQVGGSSEPGPTSDAPAKDLTPLPAPSDDGDRDQHDVDFGL